MHFLSCSATAKRDFFPDGRQHAGNRMVHDWFFSSLSVFCFSTAFVFFRFRMTTDAAVIPAVMVKIPSTIHTSPVFPSDSVSTATSEDTAVVSAAAGSPQLKSSASTQKMPIIYCFIDISTFSCRIRSISAYWYKGTALHTTYSAVSLCLPYQLRKRCNVMWQIFWMRFILLQPYIIINVHTSSGRNQLTNNHIFLQTVQHITLTTNSGIG